MQKKHVRHRTLACITDECVKTSNFATQLWQLLTCITTRSTTPPRGTSVYLQIVPIVRCATSCDADLHHKRILTLLISRLSEIKVTLGHWSICREYRSVEFTASRGASGIDMLGKGTLRLDAFTVPRLREEIEDHSVL